MGEDIILACSNILPGLAAKSVSIQQLSTCKASSTAAAQLIMSLAKIHSRLSRTLPKSLVVLSIAIYNGACLKQS